MPRAEEGDPGKAEVLMRHEDSHRDEVWLTEVVYKAADVAIETGIYAVHLSILEEKRCIFHEMRLGLALSLQLV